MGKFTKGKAAFAGGDVHIAPKRGGIERERILKKKAEGLFIWFSVTVRWLRANVGIGPYGSAFVDENAFPREGQYERPQRKDKKPPGTDKLLDNWGAACYNATHKTNAQMRRKRSRCPMQRVGGGCEPTDGGSVYWPRSGLAE